MTESRKSTRAERRRMKKAADAFEKCGCARCGTKAAPASYAFLESDKVICQRCYRPGDTIIGFMAEIAFTPPGQADDRDWFAARPQASWRLRPLHPGEARELYAREAALAIQHGEAPPEILMNLDDTTHALVHQVKPGARVRIPVLPPPAGPERDAWIERQLVILRERGEAAIGLNERLSEEDRLTVTNAAALLPVDAALGLGVLDQLRQQGEAMRESRGQQKH